MGITSSFEERYKILQDEFPNAEIVGYDKCNCPDYWHKKDSYYIRICIPGSIQIRGIFCGHKSHRNFMKRIERLKTRKILADLLYLNDFRQDNNLRWTHPTLGNINTFENSMFYKGNHYSQLELIEVLKKDLSVLLINKLAVI